MLEVVVDTLLSVLEKLSAEPLLGSLLELTSKTDASVVRSPIFDKSLFNESINNLENLLKCRQTSHSTYDTWIT